jgi:DNA-binding MarR family transcriptional regulator
MPSTSQASDPDSLASLWGHPGYLLRRAYQRKLAIFEEECAQYFITPVQYAMLAMLNDIARIDTLSLIKAAGADETAGTSALRRLKTLALIERENSSLDYRVRPIRLTKQGRQLMADVHPAVERAQERLVQSLSPDDRLYLVALLKSIVGSGIAAEQSRSGRRTPA